MKLNLQTCDSLYTFFLVSFNHQENIGCFGHIESYSGDHHIDTNFKFPSPPHLTNGFYISSKEAQPQNNTTSSSYSHSDSESASDSDSLCSNSDVYDQECSRYDNQLLPYKKHKKSLNRTRSSYNARGYTNSSLPYKHSFAHYLPPIGVFWDIENCQVSL